MPSLSCHLLRTALAAALALPCGGCCALASMFCGPDRSHWVDPGFSTPAAAVATFQEALRREHAPVLRESLAEGFKERTGVVGAIEFEVLRRELKKQVPHLHLLGEAEVGSFTTLGPDRVRTTLVRSGYRVRLELVRQRYCEVRYLVHGEPERPGRYVASFRGLLAIERDDLGRASVRLQLPPLPLAEGIAADDVEWAGIDAQWKIDLLELESGAGPERT
jgi:hypothetical protein